MILTVFEDQNSKILYPLDINHASFEIRCGAFTNLERIQNLIGPEDSIQLIVRDELAPLIKRRFPDFMVNPEIILPSIIMNGRAIWNENIFNHIQSGKTFSCKGQLISVINSEKIYNIDFFEYINKSSMVTTELDIDYFEFIWDSIFIQPSLINMDAEKFIDYNYGKIHPTVAIENGDNIYIGKGAKVKAGSVLDASYGPIIIDNDAVIGIGALIEGPVYIGKSCTINPGCKLRKNVSLGPNCKIGGELEDNIFLGYSNKQHDGYLGHSYIGEWVNLGANTNNSDLKNNYGLINIQFENKLIKTNQQFLGSMVGDFTRTGISTMLNTGATIGLGANLYGAGFQDKFVQSFHWGVDQITEIEKFLKTIEKIKKRRNQVLFKEEIDFLTQLYKNIYKI